MLSINNFTIQLLSKLLSDLSIGVHLKSVFDTKKFGSNGQYFHTKNSLSMKKLSINNFSAKLISTFLMDPCTKITKKFTKKSGSKVININYFHRKTGLCSRAQRPFQN